MKSLNQSAQGGLTNGPSPPRWVIPLAAVVGFLAYLSTLVAGVQIWAGSPDEQHGFLVAPIALALLYLRRDEFPHGESRIDLRGLVLIALAAGMRIYGDQYIRPWMHMWSLPLWIGGTVWLFGGWRVFRWAAPAIAFLVFMAPLPGQVQTAAGFPLQRIAATGGGGLLQMLGQPAFVSGTTILLGENVLDVERACSGLRMFQGMLAVAVAWCLFCRYRWPRFLAMLAIAPLIAIFVNVLRITVTGLLFQLVSGEAGQKFSHDWAGLLMIPVGVVIFFIIDSVGERLQKWNKGQVDRWLITGAVGVVVVFVLGGAAYGIYGRQQQAAVVYVLDQARELAESEEADDRVAAADLYRRYLSVHSEDAEVLSELAELRTEMGRQHWARAARLYEMASDADPDRQVDGISSLMLLASIGDWQRVWDRSERMLDRFSDDYRLIAYRLRTQAIGVLTARRGAAGDRDRMFSACREGIRDDEDYFDHHWQMAMLARSHPDLVRRSDLPAGSDSDSEGNPNSWSPDADLPLSAPDAMALAIVDRAIEGDANGARAWLYRANFLESLRRQRRSSGEAEALDREVEESVTEALQFAEANYPLGVEVPPLPSADTEVQSPEAVRRGEAIEPSQQEPVAATEDRRRVADRLIAGAVFRFAGALAVRNDEIERGRALLEHSRQLAPRNPEVYSRLVATLPRDQTDKRIDLLRRGLEACGEAEVSLLFPLVETLVSVGRDEEAAELLEPLDEVLPNLRGVARGRLQLMRDLSRAGGLARQGRLADAADLLSGTLEDETVRSNRSSYASFYARASFQLGNLYRAMGQNAAAIAAYQEGGRLDPQSSSWMLNVARAYEEAGDLTSALRSYEEAAAEFGRQQPSVYLAIARLRLQQTRQGSPQAGAIDEVRSIIRMAVENGADPVEAAEIRAETYVAEGAPEVALEKIEEQLAVTPEEPSLVFNGALIRQIGGDTDGAIEQADRLAAAGGSPARGLLLKVLLLTRANRIDEAVAAVEAAEDRFDEEQLLAPRTQIVLGKLRAGKIDEAAAELEKLAESNPSNLATQRLAASVFADLGREESVAAVEENLKRIEGERGTLWRAVRAARLLRSGSDDEAVAEAASLVDRLEQLLPNWGRTSYLRGRLAERSGRWEAALTAYEGAWAGGVRNAELAGRLLAALNQTGQTRRSGEYLEQLQELIPRSTSLFDIAMPQYVLGDRGNDALQLARKWAEEDPTPANMVRLGQTLMAIAGSGRTDGVFGSDEAVAEAIDQAEEAFTAAIRDDPTNLEAWTGAFQLQVTLRQDREQALKDLEQLSERLDVDPFQRSFLLAQLYAAIDENSRAGIELENLLEGAEGRSPELRQSVRMAAAKFFAVRRPARAIELCRQELAEFPESRLGRTYLAGLLADRGSVADLNEAIRLHSEMTTEMDPPNARLRARLFVRRANAVEAVESDVSGQRASDASDVVPDQDRREALSLLRSISPAEASDAFAIANILADQGKAQDAFNAYRDGLRLESPTVERLVTVLDFWNEVFAAEGTYAPIADDYLSQLRNLGAAVPWLRIRMQRAQTEVAASVDGEGQPSEEGTGDGVTADRSEYDSTLRQREAEIVQDYRRYFLPTRDGRNMTAFFAGLINAVAGAERSSQIPKLLRQIDAKDEDAEAISSALAMSLVRWGDDPETAEALISEIGQRVDPASDDLGPQKLIAGDALYVAGRVDLSAKYLEAAARLMPDNPQPVNNLAIVLAAQGKRSDTAVEYAERVIAMDPDNRDFRDTKLVVAMLLGDWETAEQVAETLKGDYSPTTLMHRAYLEQRQGRQTEARELFRQARDGNVSESLVTPYDRTFYEALAEQHQT